MTWAVNDLMNLDAIDQCLTPIKNEGKHTVLDGKRWAWEAHRFHFRRISPKMKSIHIIGGLKSYLESVREAIAEVHDRRQAVKCGEW